MTPKIYQVTFSGECLVQAETEEEAERIAAARINDIVDTEPVVFNGEQVAAVSDLYADSLPWTSFLYSGPEHTVQQVIDQNK